MSVGCGIAVPYRLRMMIPVRVLIRADAGPRTGTGHVMRCLALSEALTRRGHVVTLRGDLGGIGWLRERVSRAGIIVEPAVAGVLSPRDAAPSGQNPFDVAVIDSYAFPAAHVEALDRILPTLAIVDGSTRGIRASAYLDQNLGARPFPEVADEAVVLLGAPYALVRSEFTDRRRRGTAPLRTPPRIVAFMGGSDPTGAMRTIAGALATLDVTISGDLVVAPAWRAAVEAIVAPHKGLSVLAPTPDLPRLLAAADVVVSAAGTSSWDICTVGIPAVFVGVVDNQLDGLRALVGHGVGLGADLTVSDTGDALVAERITTVLRDGSLRDRLFEACTTTFDGRGTDRVADALERLAPRS